MQSDEKEIRQLVSTWMTATKSGDVETVLSLMADDAIFLVTGQAPMRLTLPRPHGLKQALTARNLMGQVISKRSRFSVSGPSCGKS